MQQVERMPPDRMMVVVTFAVPGGGEYRQKVWAHTSLRWLANAATGKAIAQAAKLASGKGQRVGNVLTIHKGKDELFNYVPDTGARFR